MELPVQEMSSAMHEIGKSLHSVQSADTNKTSRMKPQEGMTPLYSDGLALARELVITALKGDRKTVSINWKCGNEEANEAYELQRSANAEIWQTIYTKYVNADGNFQSDYAYMDQDPETPVSYYRILVKKKDGDDQVSEVTPVSFSEYSSLSVTPNPARSYAVLNLYAVSEGKGEIQVLDKKGGLRCHEAIKYKEGENEYYLELLRKLHKGMYTIRVVLNEEVLTSSLIVLK